MCGCGLVHFGLLRILMLLLEAFELFAIDRLLPLDLADLILVDPSISQFLWMEFCSYRFCISHSCGFWYLAILLVIWIYRNLQFCLDWVFTDTVSWILSWITTSFRLGSHFSSFWQFQFDWRVACRVLWEL